MPESSAAEVTIPITSGASGAVEIKDMALVAIQTPSGWTSALAITVEGALRSGTSAAFGSVYDDLGNAITIAADASRVIRLDERLFQGLAQLRFKSDGQAAARTLQLRLKPLKDLVPGSV